MKNKWVAKYTKFQANKLSMALVKQQKTQLEGFGAELGPNWRVGVAEAEMSWAGQSATGRGHV